MVAERSVNLKRFMLT